jgi:hypothetical protein
MKPAYRGVAVAVLQGLLVLSVVAKYTVDLERLPRVWAKALPFDPNLAVRGRYVSLRLQAEAPSAAHGPLLARLSAVGGRLVATPDTSGTVYIASPVFVRTAETIVTQWVLLEPVAFFIPEHVPDPSRRPAGEELWVEVSVPARGSPRPIRLGVKKNGVITPLEPR